MRREGLRPQIGAAAPASTQSSAKSGSSTDAVSGAATADGASATCTRHTDATLPGGVSPLDISASAVRTQDDGAAPRDGVSSFDASPASVPDAPAAPSGDPPAGVVRVADVCNKELLDQVSVDASSLLGYTEQGENFAEPAKASLHNPGNMCYINAMLHVLARTPSVRHWAMKHLELHAETPAHAPCSLCDLGADLRFLYPYDMEEPTLVCICIWLSLLG